MNIGNEFIFGILAFIVGNVTGYFLHDFLKKTLSLSESTSKNFVLFIVTISWLMAMLVSLLNPAYQVPLPVHGLMGAIVGFFFYKPK